MPRPSSLASVVIDVSAEPKELSRPEPDTPFRILLLGDFSGSGRQGQTAGRVLKPVLVDRDNFDEVLARFAPEVRLPLGNGEVSVRFGELEDFHPDRMFERLEPFQALRDLRARLSDAATFRAAAAAMGWAPDVASKPVPPPPTSGADLLSQMMGEEPAAAPARPRDDWSRMLSELVAPYLEPRPDPKQADLTAQVDAAIAGQMRAILHHSAFQAIESAWRGVFFLVRRLETGESLKLYLLDIPAAEAASADGAARLRRWAVEESAQTPGAEPWAVMAGLYQFGPEHEAPLAELAAVAAEAGAPLVAGAAPSVLGVDSLEGSTDPRHWAPPVFESLRRSPEARWLGLALPRFLLRLPYGRLTDSTELFAFEEMPGAPEHASYLWANPAIACACLLGEAFNQFGWEFRPGAVREIESLPAHVFTASGESEIKPCAEVLLTESAAENMMDRGLMPLLSLKGSDRIRLARFQSVADPPAPLAGRWQ